MFLCQLWIWCRFDEYLRSRSAFLPHILTKPTPVPVSFFSKFLAHYTAVKQVWRCTDLMHDVEYDICRVLRHFVTSFAICNNTQNFHCWYAWPSLRDPRRTLSAKAPKCMKDGQIFWRTFDIFTRCIPRFTWPISCFRLSSRQSSDWHLHSGTRAFSPRPSGIRGWCSGV